MNKRYKIHGLIIAALIILVSNLAFGWTLLLMGDLSESYDDNVTLSSVDKEYDFVTNFMAGLGVRAEGNTYNLDFLGHVYQQIYLKEKNLNYNSQDATFLLRKELLSVLGFQLQEVFHHYPQPQTFSESFGSTGGIGSYYNNIITLTLTYNIISELNLIAEYYNNLTRNISGNMIDTTINGTKTSLEYFYNPNNIFSLLYNFEDVRYDNGVAYTIHGTGLRYQHNFTQQLTFDCTNRVDFFRSNDPKRYTALNLLYSLRDQVDETTGVSISFNKQFIANAYSSDLFDSWNVNCSASKQFTMLFSGSASVFYGEGRYLNTDTKTRFVGTTITVSYEITERIRTSLTYSFTKNDTQTEEYTSGYDRNIITLALHGEI